MPLTLFPSHSSNLYQTHCHCFNPQPLQISSSLNPKPPKNPSENPFPLSLNSPKEIPDSKPPWEPMKTPPTPPWVPMKTPPTPPWVITTPLVTQPNEIVDPRRPTSRENPRDELSGKLVNRRGKYDTRRIARSIEMLGERVVRLGESPRRSFFGDGLVSPFEGSAEEREKMPWETEVGFVVRRMKKEKVASSAELKLERGLLERLRGEAGKMRKWVKVKKAGVTQEVVSYVWSIWKSDELVMVRFDVPLCRNMDRAQEILELKTGGLVVWRRKDTLVVYRGCDYRPSTKTYSKIYTQKTSSEAEQVRRINSIFGYDVAFDPKKSLYEREADRLLEGLGPRFVDWWMNKPLPVDADLLPEVVCGYRPPARRSLPSTRSQLTDYELTHLRGVARPLPTHFVLGRNRKLQGLAAAILKLWEKCHIAKIALKMGALNTSNKEMAYELKYLTGGVLLLRNKFIILLYRGKDFLPPQVSDLISERESALEKCQIYEENARLEVGETLLVADEPQESAGTAGTLTEFQDIQSEYVDANIMEKLEIKLPFEAEKEKLQRELKNQERKLSILIRKIERSTAELVKLNGEWKPSELSADQEFITQEERECLRNIGVKMRGVLVLGRRGVFDGVIEGLRQHWKHREIAKVISMQRLYWRVLHTAKMLEAESGGILISVEKLKHGHAILMYRGKNYRRPIRVNSGNLLTKRQALHRSLEMQRNGSLKFFAYQRQKAISELKLKLENLHSILEVDLRKHNSLE